MADPLELPGLAAIAGVSVRQLTRLFKAKLGYSPMTYYRDLRLDVAERFLTGSALSLTEIALATGFANSSHFSKAYAMRRGNPPSHLRN